jgi:hypothetical protein
VVSGKRSRTAKRRRTPGGEPDQVRYGSRFDGGSEIPELVAENATDPARIARALREPGDPSPCRNSSRSADEADGTKNPSRSVKYDARAFRRKAPRTKRNTRTFLPRSESIGSTRRIRLETGKRACRTPSEGRPIPLGRRPSIPTGRLPAGSDPKTASRASSAGGRSHCRRRKSHTYQSVARVREKDSRSATGASRPAWSKAIGFAEGCRAAASHLSAEGHLYEKRRPVENSLKLMGVLPFAKSLSRSDPAPSSQNSVQALRIL